MCVMRTTHCNYLTFVVMDFYQKKKNFVVMDVDPSAKPNLDMDSLILTYTKQSVNPQSALSPTPVNQPSNKKDR